jgi:hypothetical protein
MDRQRELVYPYFFILGVVGLEVSAELPQPLLIGGAKRFCLPGSLNRGLSRRD